MSPSKPNAEPPKPERLKVEILDLGDSLTLNYQARQWGASAFLIVWLTFWTFGCVALAVMAWQEPKLQTIVFGIPFWSSWGFVFAYVLSMLFKRERVLLNDEGLSYSQSVVIPLQDRVAPLAELRQFVSSSTTNYGEDDSPIHFVELITLGQPVLMLPYLPAKERNWLIWRLNKFVEEARKKYPQAPVDSPSDCSWQIEEFYDTTVFTQRGRPKLAMLGTTLFVCLFWNSIVSLFVLQFFGFLPDSPQSGTDRWFLALFLTPFVIVGLGMVGILAYVLMEPFRRTRLEVSLNEISYGSRWFGLGRSRHYEIDSVNNLKVQTRRASESKFQGVTMSMQTTASQQHELHFSGEGKSPTLIIKRLTEGEAHWMASRILKIHPDWSD